MSSVAVGWVLQHSDERLGARLVLLVLAEHASSDGTNAWPSVATIQREARLESRRTVQTALRDLEARGAITKVSEGPNGTSNWTVNMGAQILHPPDGGAQSTTEGGRNLRHEGGANIAPEPTTEPTTEPSSRADEQTSLIPTPKAELWGHWLTRSGRREKLSSAHDRLLRDALKVRSLDECKLAVDAICDNPWWRDNNKLELRHAIGANRQRGTSAAETIDKRITEAKQKAGLSNSADGGTIVDRLCARFPSVDRRTIAFWLEGINNGLRFPNRTQYTKNGRLRKFHELGVDLIIDEEQGAVTGWTEVNE